MWIVWRNWGATPCNDMRRPWFAVARENGWLRLKQTMKRWKINNIIYQVMWYGWQSWTNSEDPDEIQVPILDIEQLTREAMRAQTLIGWNHFMLGRVAKQWRECIGNDMENDMYKQGKISGAMKALVESLWKMMLELWRVRNSSEHEEKIYIRSRTGR